MGVGRLEHSATIAGATDAVGAGAPLAAKRAIDVVVAGLALLVLAPVLLLISVAILVLEGRPILYRQERVGRFGHLFTIYKFRTMVPDAHQRLSEVAHANERGGPLFKATADPRVTSIGRFLRRTSLDELPQLVNVLIGDMSLVGPRPALPEERAQFPAELLEREQLPQGLSGLWQLQGRHSSDFEVYRELDLQYVRTWTLRRDLLILVRTPFVVGSHALRRQPCEPEASTAVASTTTNTTSREVGRIVLPRDLPPARTGGQIGGVAAAPVTVSVRRSGAPAPALSLSVLDD